MLLVTSRETRRWVLPKGWTEKRGRGAQQAAQGEAFEEAGIRGRIETTPIGAYAYPKRLDCGATVTCDVEVFALEVERLLDDWPGRASGSGAGSASPEAAMAGVKAGWSR